MRPLSADFYERPVLEVARELIGCVVEHADSSGVIVETEAYHETEPACHAFAGLTARTAILFGAAGQAYVYRSYGIHALLNAVCEQEGTGAAVLIRALAPLTGVGLMWQRRRTIAERSARRGPARERDLCSGPGKLTQALGIELPQNNTSLSNGPVRIYGRRAGRSAGEVAKGPRVGITKAVDLPWRFCLLGDLNVSAPRPRPAPP